MIRASTCSAHPSEGLEGIDRALKRPNSRAQQSTLAPARMQFSLEACPKWFNFPCSAINGTQQHRQPKSGLTKVQEVDYYLQTD